MMNEYQDLALAFIGVATLYFATRNISTNARSKSNKKIEEFLVTLESDLEAEIKRTEGFETNYIKNKHEDLKTAYNMLKKIDFRNKRFKLEDIEPIYIVCNFYRVGYFKDSESDSTLNHK